VTVVFAGIVNDFFLTLAFVAYAAWGTVEAYVSAIISPLIEPIANTIRQLLP
jgi:hypothetical protein